MGIVETVKKGFLLSNKLLKVVLIFFILNAIMGLISLPLTTPESAGKPAVAAVSFILSLVFFAIFIFLQGGALGLVRDIYKTGNCDVNDFSVYGKKYYLKILGVLSIYILIAVGVALILFMIGGGALFVANNVFVRALVAAIAVVVGLVAVVLLLFPIYSIVADESTILEAIKKGISVSRNNFWNVLKIFLLLIVISIGISLAIGFIVGLITIPLPLIVTRIVITLANSAVQAYIPVVMMLVLMGYYFRVGKGSEPS